MNAPRRSLLRAAGFAALAAVLAAAPARAQTGTAPSAPAARTPVPQSVRNLLQQYYPQVLQDGTEPGAVLAFVIGAGGSVQQHQLLAAPGNIDGALGGIQPDRIDSVNVYKTLPGELGPTAVQVVVVQLKS